MHFGKYVLSASLFLIIVALAAVAGCLSTVTAQDRSTGPVHAHYQYQDSWSPGLGCYSHLTGYVYNAGNTSTQDMRLDFNLVNSATGTIRDSRAIYIGSLSPGETRSYESILDGECTQEYRVDFAVENP